MGGFVSGVAVVVPRCLMLSVYVHYPRRYPKEKALVDSLKQRPRRSGGSGYPAAGNGRQHELAVARRIAYDRSSLILLLSAVVFPGVAEVVAACLEWTNSGQIREGA